MQKTIFLREVLSEMKKLDDGKNPIPFSISVRTFSRQDLSGGKLTHYDFATLLQPPKNKGKLRLADSTNFKNANHFSNRTRNIKTENGIQKINILFITHFNGLPVIF